MNNTTAVFDPSENPSHPLPGQGVPTNPPGGPWTPWVPGAPSTGVKPPGWRSTFIHILTDLLAKTGPISVDDSMLDLIANLTDRMLARWPV